MQKIIFCGGGSGGHVLPALTLIQKIKQQSNDVEILYIGGFKSIEKELVQAQNISYRAIHTGKLRRYLSLENLKDMLNVVRGFFDALFILKRENKSNSLIVFSTGGFVSVPVVLAARLLRIPIFIHEQTSRVGLANKIASRFANKIFISFKASANYFPSHKVIYSGYPLRDECYDQKIRHPHFKNIDLQTPAKPILFVTGGGNGAKLINDFIARNLSTLAQHFTIIHQVGKSFIDQFEPLASNDYLPCAFVGPEMIDLFKASKIVLSRSGAGTVCELLALQKPSIFIPLKIAQKNEQYHNAKEAQLQLSSVIVEEDQMLDDQILLNAILNFNSQKIFSSEITSDSNEKASELILKYLSQFRS